MNTKELSILRAKIKALLEDKGNYEETDDFLIDNLIFNIKLYAETKVLLEQSSLIEQTSWGRKITPEFELKQRLEKEIKSDFLNLGINPRERAKLKLNLTKETEDKFGEIFG